jgi:hypothetical protein
MGTGTGSSNKTTDPDTESDLRADLNLVKCVKIAGPWGLGPPFLLEPTGDQALLLPGEANLCLKEEPVNFFLLLTKELKPPHVEKFQLFSP